MRLGVLAERATPAEGFNGAGARRRSARHQRHCAYAPVRRALARLSAGIRPIWEAAALNGLLRKPREGRLYVWAHKSRLLVWIL